MRVLGFLLVLASCWPRLATAHVIEQGGAFNPWLVDPFAVALLMLTGCMYWRGSRRSPRKSARSHKAFIRRRRYFWMGWGTLAIALASPLDPMGEVLFWAHMVQHELMMLIAAPLLVASRPSSALLRGVPMSMARVFGALARPGAMQGFWWFLVAPPVAWTIHAVGLWGWHLPFLFAASLTNTWIHALQHLSFLWIALVFWFSLMRTRRSDSPSAVLYFFTTAIHASLLGALLTFAPEPWYGPYVVTAPEWGLTALEDQQLGGLIMWMPAGIVFIAAGLFSLARTMRESDSLLAGDLRGSEALPANDLHEEHMHLDKARQPGPGR